VQDDVGALDGRGDVLRVADVAEDDLGLPVPQRLREDVALVQPPQGTVGVVEAERPHLRAVSKQPLDGVAADETIRPGDEHGLSGDRSFDGPRGQFDCHSGLFVVLSFVIDAVCR
jgi:hypothetical protein